MIDIDYNLPPPDPAQVLARRFQVLAVLYLLLLIGGAVYVFGHRHADSYSSPTSARRVAIAKPAVDTGAVAVVNGQPITWMDAYRALDADEGRHIVQRLVRERVILQEADRQHLKLDDPDSLSILQHLNDQVPDPNYYQVAETTTRARLFLRKLVTRNVPESTMLRIYREFHDELSTYEVFEIRVRTPAAAQQVEAALRTEQTFAQVAARYSADRRAKKSGGRVGYLSLAQIESQYGPGALDFVYQDIDTTQLASAPLPLGPGFVILRIGRINSDYHELKPAISDLLVEADGGALLYRLMAHAQVSFPVHETNLKSRPPAPSPAGTADDETQIFAPPSAVPVGSKSPGFLTLPSAVKSARPDSPFAPLPAPVQHATSGVFAPLPAPVQHATSGVFAPLPSAVKASPEQTPSESPHPSTKPDTRP